MDLWRSPAGLLLACALLVGCARGEPRVGLSTVIVAPARTAPASAPPVVPGPRPRVIPSGTTDDELLDGQWRLEEMPAVSRDGRRVTTVLRESSGYRALVDEANPSFDEPEGMVEYANWVFVVVDVRMGAIERREILVHAGELDLAQRNRSKPALAARVRRRLSEVDRFFADGDWEGLHSVELEGKPELVVDGVSARLTAGRLSLTDSSGRTRLDVAISAWSRQPLPLGSGFTCLYTARVDELAIDQARGIAVIVVGQDTNGGDACSGAANAERQIKVLRLTAPALPR